MSTLTINRMDYSPLNRALIGFDQLFQDFESRFQQTATNYPPYNVIKHNENHYEIQVAIAGFDRSEIAVEVDQGQLTIRGQKTETEESITYLHRGLATRNFVRTFTLADHMLVNEAECKDGILSIRLERQVPEALKPRQIPVK